MFGTRNLNRHAALMNKMAETLGVDLEAALRRGKLSSTEWRDALVDCTGCADPAGCMSWLGEHGAPEDRHGHLPEDQAPEFCSNRMMMARLRDAQDAETPVTQSQATASIAE